MIKKPKKKKYVIGQIILHVQRNLEQGWDGELMGQGSIFSWALREGLTGGAPELITPAGKAQRAEAPRPENAWRDP